MRTVFVYLLVLCRLACPLLAQSTKAELFGTVRDTAGLAVAGASVVLTNPSTGVKLSIESGPDGAYHVFAIPTGSYEIMITKQGFTALHRSGITIRVGD